MSKATNRFFREVREPGVWRVFNNQGRHGLRWQAGLSILSKIGCVPWTVNNRVKKAQVGSGKRAGASSGMAGRRTALERENRVSRRTSEVLCKARAHFALAPFGECVRSPAGQRKLGCRRKA